MNEEKYGTRPDNSPRRRIENGFLVRSAALRPAGVPPDKMSSHSSLASRRQPPRFITTPLGEEISPLNLSPTRRELADRRSALLPELSWTAPSSPARAPHSRKSRPLQASTSAPALHALCTLPRSTAESDASPHCAPQAMVFKQRCPELTWRVLNHQLMPAAVRLNLASTPQAIKPVASFPGRWHPLLQRLQQMDSSSDRVRQLSVDKLAQVRRRRIWARVRKRLLIPAERKIALLSRIPFLEKCSSNEIRVLASAMRLRLVPHIRRLVQPFKLPMNFCLILDGEIEAYDGTTWQVLGPGDFYGTEALGTACATEKIPSVRSISTVTPTLQLELIDGCKDDANAEEESYAYELRQLLRRLRPFVERYLKALMLLRFPQFGYLRANFGLRSRAAECLSYRFYAKGARLIERGQSTASTSLFFIVQGVVDVVAQDETGELVHLGSVSSDDQKPYVGELSVFGKVQATATVLSRSSIHCLVLPYQMGATFGGILPEFKDQAEITARKVRSMNMDSLAQSTIDPEAITQLIAETKAKVSEMRPRAMAKGEVVSLLPRVITPVASHR